jgi:hydroxyacylglutathione hydrolase
MELLRFTNGMFDSNAYIVHENNKGVLIDAGVPKDRILKEVWDKNIDIDDIILTHEHIDHVYYVDELKLALKAKVSIHTSAANAFYRSSLNGSALFGMPKDFEEADNVIIENDDIMLLDNKLKIIHTPGHSIGSICIYVNGYLFSGDTIFRMSVGRTDLTGGSMSQLEYSIKNKIFRLPDDTEILPGHGPKTTVEYEKRNNPFIG